MKQNLQEIGYWCAEDRPDYKLENKGVRELTTSELISLIISDNVEVAKNLLQANRSSLLYLSNQSVESICKFDGIGKTKAMRILAALELGKRRDIELTKELPDLGTAVSVYKTMAPLIADLDKEEFWVLLMNNNFKLIKKVCISKGGITETIVDVRIIIKEALLAGATILVACHNHPSGNIKPSKYDNDITNTLNNACQLMRIKLLDHVIVTQNNYYSYHENGLI